MTNLSAASFDFIRRLLADRSAIVLDEEKAYLVETRLLPVARQAGLPSLDDLVTQLHRAPNGSLCQQVVEAMTTNETSFFRDDVPFEFLRSMILPALIASRAASRQLNIWSAGCASGQEPYSVALLLREHFSHLCDWNFRVLGSDLSAEALQRARLARFTQFEVNRGLPAHLLQKYFHQAGGEWQLDHSIRQMVEFRQFNLSGEWPSLPKMDIVLLRNVLVYFDVAIRKEILRKIRRVLRADGYVLLGGAETVIDMDNAFRVVRGKGFSYYQLRHPG